MKTVLKKLKSTEQAICVISKMFFFLLSWFLLGIQVHVLTTIVTNYVLVLYYRFYWCQINTVLQLYRYNGIYSCRIWHLYECTFCHAKVAVNNKHCVLCRSSNRNIIWGIQGLPFWAKAHSDEGPLFKMVDLYPNVKPHIIINSTLTILLYNTIWL